MSFLNRFGVDFSAARATLANRNFAMFTLGNAISIIGTWVQRVAVGWLTWHLTKSGTWLGAVAMAEFLPAVALAPITGVMADRFDRRRIAVVGQCAATVQAALLAALTISDHITAGLVFTLQLMSGVIQPLIQTARLVLVPSLLPREYVGNAVAITSLTFNLARIVGPALAGVLITAVGAGFAFALNAASYVGVIVALIKIRMPPQAPRVRAHAVTWRGMWTEMMDGWRYTFTHPVLRVLMVMVAITSTLTWPLGDLLAGIADREFNRGTSGLAILASAQGLGALCGSLFLAHRKNHNDLLVVLIRAMAFSGVFVALFAVTKIFWLALPLLALSGTFGVLTGAGSQTVTQTAATDEMRGRTLSVWYTVTRTGPAVGAVMLGSLSSLFGFTTPLFIAGALSAAAAVMLLRRGNVPAVGVPVAKTP